MKSSIQPCATHGKVATGKGLTHLLAKAVPQLWGAQMDRETSRSLIPSLFSKPSTISQKCKDQNCTKPSRCGCVVTLESHEGVLNFTPFLTIPDTWFASTAARCGNIWVRMATIAPCSCA